MENEKIELPKEFCDSLKEQLGEDFEKYLLEMKKPSVRGLRVNTAKVSVGDFVKNTILPLKKLHFCDDGFVLQTDEKLGNTLEHIAGEIYLQEPSSMLAVSSVNLKSGAKVLDLCAAPGGKTSQIASRVADGLVVSNEIISSRASILFSNIERQGFDNVIVLNEKPENLKVFKNYFDYVFVDAPCSGEGMFRKNPETINEWSLGSVKLCEARQKDILNVAKDLVKPNGILVYSTCTFNTIEDEGIVKYLIEELGFELQDVCDEIKKYTLPSSLKIKNGKMARKFYPFVEAGEGQFIAVLKKSDFEVENFKVKKYTQNIKEIGRSERKLLEEFVNNNIESSFAKTLLNKSLVKVGDFIYALPDKLNKQEIALFDELKFVSLGVKLGSIVKGRFEPHHMLFMTYGKYFKNQAIINEIEFAKYMHGEELSTNINEKCFASVSSNGKIIGGGKIVNGKVKNMIPKGLRI